MITRTCKACGKTLPLDAEHFVRGTGYRDGFRPSCKSCSYARNSYLNRINGTEAKRYQRDKAKRDAHVAAWIAKNRERRDSYMRKYRSRSENGERKFTNHLRSVYGIERATYDAIYRAQGGVCAICGAVPAEAQTRKMRLCLDHDHETGELRGLLCDRCNRGIGFFQDDPGRLTKAAAYITKHRTATPAKVISI